MTRPDHACVRSWSGLCELFLAAYQRKHGALRVLAVDDPATAGNLHGTIQDFPAAGIYTIDSGADGIDIEIEVPAGDGDVGCFGHHAAVAHLMVVAFIED